MKVNMKPILLIIALIALIFSCKNESETYLINGQLLSHSECKSMKSGAGISMDSDSLSCVEYAYEETNNKLHLKHINAGFNCCPGNLTCNVSISNDTILIQEKEQFAQCNCDCLYEKRIY